MPTSKETRRTIDSYYSNKGREYFKSILKNGYDNSETYINKLYAEVPNQFVREHLYLKSREAITYAFIEEYRRYSDIFTLMEYKALKYSEQVIDDLVTFQTPIEVFIAGVVTDIRGSKNYNVISSLSKNEISQVALYLLLLRGITDESLLPLRIPGICKIALMNIRQYFKGYRLRLRNYSSIHYTKALITDGVITSVIINKKAIPINKVIKWLSKRLPFAMLREDGEEGIYLDSGVVKVYYPYVKEVSIKYGNE